MHLRFQKKDPWFFQLPISVIFILLSAMMPLNLFGQDKVRIRLDVANAVGDSISTIAKGEDFLLNTYVTDLRETAPLDQFGVFAAYMDVTYSLDFVSVAGPIDFIAPYQNGKQGTMDVGGIDEVGAFGNATLTGKDEHLLFSVPFTAIEMGDAFFQSDPADNLPFGYVLVYGEEVEVPTNRIEYGGVGLKVVPEPDGVWLFVVCLLGMFYRARRL